MSHILETNVLLLLNEDNLLKLFKGEQIQFDFELDKREFSEDYTFEFPCHLAIQLNKDKIDLLIQNALLTIAKENEKNLVEKSQE